MQANLGTIVPNTAALLIGEVNFVDGAGNPADPTATGIGLYAAGETSPITANVTTLTLTKIGGIAGLYKLTCTLAANALSSAGTYVIRLTGGTVGSPEMILTGLTIATLTVGYAPETTKTASLPAATAGAAGGITVVPPFTF